MENNIDNEIQIQLKTLINKIGIVDACYIGRLQRAAELEALPALATYVKSCIKERNVSGLYNFIIYGPKEEQPKRPLSCKLHFSPLLLSRSKGA